MRRVGSLLLALICAVYLLSCSPGKERLSARPIGFWQDVIKSHRISGSDIVAITSARTAEKAAFGGVYVRLEISTSGEVIRAVGEENDTGVDTAPAIEAVRRWRFRPFNFDGATVIAVGTVEIGYKGPELWQNPNAQFPTVDYDHLLIALERSDCVWSCPAYRVEIRGSGEVVFTTRYASLQVAATVQPIPDRSGVLVPGRHVSRIGRAELDSLISRFREANFFGLKNSYQAPVTDSADYALTFQSGEHSKRVVDYVGDQVGMPAVVTGLENEIDRVAGTRRWVSGEAGTGPALAIEGFDFSSAIAQRVVLAAARAGSEEMILDFIARGVPLDALQSRADSHGAGETGMSEAPLGALLLEQSVRFGRAALFGELMRRGWLARTPTPMLAQAFVDGGGGCSSAMAEGLIQAGVDPAWRDADGKTALMVVLGPYPCRELKPEEKRRLATELIRLGVPLDATDKEGETALYKSQDLEMVRLLLAAGSRADIRNKAGRSPALSSGDDRVVLTLLAAGADPLGRNSANESLRQAARKHNMPGTLAWLNERRIP